MAARRIAAGLISVSVLLIPAGEAIARNGVSNITPPAISGNAVVGSTLTASPGTWTGSPTSYTYTWHVCGPHGGSCSVMAVTSSTYVIQSADVGHRFKVRVRASNGSGAASAVSALTPVVQPASTAPVAVAPSDTGLPSVSGTAQVGQTLTSSNGSWSGTAPIGYGYGWEDCNSSGASCVAIAGATSSTYVLAAGDQGHTVRVVVTASNTAGQASASSAQTGAVQAAPPPPSGQTVMVFDVGWAPSSSMPWSELTQADLFDLATENGPGLDTSNVNGVNIAAWVGAAHSHGVQAMISIGGSDDQNWQNACNNTNRAQFVTNLINYAVSNGFDGVDLDIEDNAWLSVGPPTAAMTTCIEAIATAAHAATSHAGKPLWVSADVITNWAGPWFAPSQSYVDQFNLMTYGDNLSTLNSDVQDTFNQGLPYAKMVEGIDVADYAPPSGGCGAYETYASQHSLMGSFVWLASTDTGNTCINQIAAAG